MRCVLVGVAASALGQVGRPLGRVSPRTHHLPAYMHGDPSGADPDGTSALEGHALSLRYGDGKGAGDGEGENYREMASHG